MKIANIIEEGRYGGPQARIVAVAERLKTQDIETLVIFPVKDSAILHKRLSNNGIRAIRLSLSRLTSQKALLMTYILSFVWEIFALIKVIKRENPDIVQANGSSQIKGLISARVIGKRVVWVLNSTTPRKSTLWLFLLFSRWCNGLVLTGKRVHDLYLANKRLQSIPHVIIQPPVDVKKFNPEEGYNKRNILTKRSNAGLNIVTIANINPIKGLEYFIEMAHILSKEGKKLNFFTVGPQLQSQKKYSMRLAGLLERYEIENLEFIGASYEIQNVLAETDIFVCTSLFEAGPMTVWEAMAMAKPIVSTNVGDVSLFIQDGENGFVVPPGNAKLLAEKVRLLIRNEKLRREIGRKARETAIEHLDIEICARKYADFYRSVLAKKSA